MPSWVRRVRWSLTYPLIWISLSIVVLTVDYAGGPVIQYSTFFIVPVSAAAWLSGRSAGVGLALVLSLVRLSFAAVLDPPWTFAESAINAVIRISVLGLFAVLVDKAHQSLAIAREVEVLRGLLPICSFCKRIRDSQDVWQPLEGFISERSKASFTHSVCPACTQEHYAETFDRR